MWQTRPNISVNRVQHRHPQQVHDQREHSHHLKEQEYLCSHGQTIRFVEIVQKILEIDYLKTELFSKLISKNAFINWVI